MGHLPHSGVPDSRVLCSGPSCGWPTPARPCRSPGMPDRTIDNGQLALELPSTLPAIAIEPEWKDQPRLWGHSLHPMCSYLASFPAALAHAFIARYSRPGDVVLDPFSGRGTAPLQALAEGRIGVGNDLNPLAQLLTAAKVEPGHPAETRTRLAALRLAWNADAAAGSPSASASWPTRGPRPPCRRRLRRRPGRGRRARPGRGRARVPPADARPAAVPAQPPRPRRPRRPLPRRRARGHPPRQDAELPVHAHAEHVQHGAALRARLRGDRTGYVPPDRDAFDAPLREARPPVPPAAAARRRASRSLGDARTAGRRAAPRSGARACRTGRASS